MSSKVLVTGGSGKLGRAVVMDLQKNGYTVLNADQNRATTAATIRADLCDLGQIYPVIRKVDAIVHLAAIPSPLGHPPQVVFQNNVLSTFNVLQAAGDMGIEKIIIASSLAALGIAYKTHPVILKYLPLDEAHPLLPQDAYGISKVVTEELADGFSRLNPNTSIVSFRFPLLVEPGEIVDRVRPNLSERVGRGAGLWSYLDVRDAAIVIRQAIQAELRGHEVFYANAPDTFSDTHTLDLIRQYLDCDKCDERLLTEYKSPITCKKASKLLNFAPRFFWRDATDQAKRINV